MGKIFETFERIFIVVCVHVTFGLVSWCLYEYQLDRDVSLVSLKELGEDDLGAPVQDEEFVLYHADNIQATGFLEHIKLPHYVDFQSELELIRKLRREADERNDTQEAAE